MMPFGFLNVDKPSGMTSHDVVNRVRRSLRIKKAGHAGTLDPLATGVLIICLGQATRLSEYVMDTTKQYRARICLGVTTETYDSEGQITAVCSPSGITREQVEQLLVKFQGTIDQVPPMYSAIKQGGRKLYELARAGEIIERQPRRVRIESISITHWDLPVLTLEVLCSAGTYIRSLAHDLGQALGVGAYLAGLTRTASGNFCLEGAAPLESLLSDPDWQRFIVSPQQALAHWPALRLDAAAVAHVLHGRAFHDAAAEPGGMAVAYSPEGVFIAILKAEAGCWKPHKVFAQRD